MNVAGIPAERIVLLGQSLGTAVVSGVAERYAVQGVEFAGIILVSGFSDLTTMLSEYRIAGIFPVLAPFRAWPALLKLFHYFIVDKWQSDNRLASIVRHTKKRLRLSLIHSRNDPDIPWTEDNKLFRAAVMEKVDITDDEAFEAWKDERTIKKGERAFVTTWNAEPNIHVRQELFPYGGKQTHLWFKHVSGEADETNLGHNKVMGYAPVSLAIMRSFDLHGTTYA